MEFELTNIDEFIATGKNHGYVPVLAEDQDQPIGIYEWHTKSDGGICAAYFTVVPCCETGRCPHWTTVLEWSPLSTGSTLHCPTCGMSGQVKNGRWVEEPHPDDHTHDSP